MEGGGLKGAQKGVRTVVLIQMFGSRCPLCSAGAALLSAQRGRGRSCAQCAGQLVWSGDLPRPRRDRGLPPCCAAAGALDGQAGSALSQARLRLLLLPATVTFHILPAVPVGVWELGGAGFSVVPSVSLLGPPSGAPGRFGLQPLLAPVPLSSGLHPVPLVGGPATLLLGSAAPAGCSRSPPVAVRIWAQQLGLLGALRTLLPAVSCHRVSRDVQRRQERWVGGRGQMGWGRWHGKAVDGRGYFRQAWGGWRASIPWGGIIWSANTQSVTKIKITQTHTHSALKLADMPLHNHTVHQKNQKAINTAIIPILQAESIKVKIRAGLQPTSERVYF